ncbi:hypothetical protein ASL20_23860 [Cupriavidus necator]|nr:hypothetical protein ASL20_23860 [Cupriavidus necator]
MLKAQCIAYDHLETDIESVTVEFYDLVGAHGRPTFRLIVVRKPLQVRGACRPCRGAETARQLVFKARG